jgi:hypothetical protein
LTAIAVDDRQIVDSISLPPTRTQRLDTGLATSRATTVTLTEPVAARLVTVAALGSTTSNVTTDDTVPACSPIVATVQREGDMPREMRARIALVDTHRVDAMVLPPTRPVALYADWPALLKPTTVTLWEPVTAAFVNTTLLRDTPSCVMAEARLSVNTEDVDTTVRPASIPVAERSCMADDDTQVVASTRLPPWRTNAE